MRKNALVIAGLALLSTNAFASKARVQALGQDTLRGSEYISDSRNVFRNPAAINETKNYLVTEWGNATAADTNDAPRAEGGFFREMGAFNYGVYMGNNGDEAANADRVTNGFIAQDNALDLFIGGDMGVKWGARVHYANSKDESQPTATPVERKNNTIGLGLGVVAGAAEGYVNVDIINKSEGSTTSASDEIKGKPSFIVGGSYTWSEYTFFGSYENMKTEATIGGTSLTEKGNEIVVGAGRMMEINPTARIFGDLQVNLATEEDSTGKVKTNKLPATIGMEADATSWLTLRGSISQNIFLNQVKNAAGKKATIANTTTVAAGATLNFGKLKVDGLIGTSAAARNGGVATTPGTNAGTLTTDNLMTRVAVSYWF